jgi:alanine dehydrogenase
VTAPRALTDATLPYVEAIAGRGVDAPLAADPVLPRGANVIDGPVTYEAVTAAHDLEYEPLGQRVAA